jgi:nitrite reductase/ring-hydroxylating ferredoxin subunit
MADPGLIRICESASLDEGGLGVRFDVTTEQFQGSGFVVRHQGQVRAYLNRCAHVGLELDWIPGHFLDGERRWLICSAHGALYEPDTGACAGGPCAGRGGLVAMMVTEVDGVVYWRRGGARSSA